MLINLHSTTAPRNRYSVCVHISFIKELEVYELAMLYVIGLGLSDEKDITVKGLEVCRLALCRCGPANISSHSNPYDRLSCANRQ